MASQEADPTNIKEDIKKKPGPNNPEEATKFVQEVDKTVQKFMDTVHQYEPYSIQNAYSDFIERYYNLLCELKITTKMPLSPMFLNSLMIQLVRSSAWRQKKKELTNSCVRTQE